MPVYIDVVPRIDTSQLKIAEAQVHLDLLRAMKSDDPVVEELRKSQILVVEFLLTLTIKPTE